MTLYFLRMAYIFITFLYTAMCNGVSKVSTKIFVVMCFLGLANLIQKSYLQQQSTILNYPAFGLSKNIFNQCLGLDSFDPSTDIQIPLHFRETTEFINYFQKIVQLHMEIHKIGFADNLNPSVISMPKVSTKSVNKKWKPISVT